jgi:WD40 repeat protein
VNKVPYKVLDAPDLQDDFYLNLVDWGSSNVLGVGLANSVYMWNSHTGGVTRLCELKDDTVTSVSWIQRVSKESACHLPIHDTHIRDYRVHILQLALVKVSYKYGMLSTADAYEP